MVGTAGASRRRITPDRSRGCLSFPSCVSALILRLTINLRLHFLDFFFKCGKPIVRGHTPHLVAVDLLAEDLFNVSDILRIPFCTGRGFERYSRDIIVAVIAAVDTDAVTRAELGRKWTCLVIRSNLCAFFVLGHRHKTCGIVTCPVLLLVCSPASS